MSDRFVPRILIVGDVNRCRVKIETHKLVSIVGKISFAGEKDGINYNLMANQKILLNDKIVDCRVITELSKQSAFDYIVFENIYEFKFYHEVLSRFLIDIDQLMTLEHLIHCVKNYFFSFKNFFALTKIFEMLKIKTILDADSFFYNGFYYAKPNDEISIDSINKMGGVNRFPIFNNIYNRIFKSREECKFRHYDVILLIDERDYDNLMQDIIYMKDMTEKFLIFVRKGSELINRLSNNEVGRIEVINGFWILIQVPKNNSVGVYVVTHKKYNMLDLPKGYTIVQAGKAINEDLGFIGDDTGDNISNLNSYLNEMTVMYWLWKNKTDEYIGISHYHRFFTNKYPVEYKSENILTCEEIYDLLQRYDIIVNTSYHESTRFSMKERLYFHIQDLNSEIIDLVVNLMRKMIEIHQPNYLKSFDFVFDNSITMNFLSMFVTRKYIFDSYCQWIFPLILSVEKELKKYLSLDDLKGNSKRILGYICEMMLDVWLINNDLRIKELPVIIGSHDS